MNVTSWIFANVDAVQLLLYGTLLGVCGLLEHAIPRRVAAPARRVRWPTNFALTLLNIAAQGALPVSMVAAAVWAQQRQIGVLPWLLGSGTTLAALTLLIRAFLSFGTHYLMHHVPVLWRVHRVHHLDTHLDVSTTVRFHPLEFVVASAVAVPTTVMLGLDPMVLLWYELLDLIVNVWSHSNMRLPRDAGLLLRYLVVTPDQHAIHHSVRPDETNSNFGAVFPWWDLAFGTFRTQAHQSIETLPMGLDDEDGSDVHAISRLLQEPWRSSRPFRRRS